MPIRQLPPDVVNKIAAGEVIERPASVIKELLENAVDAHARRVDVFLEKGGNESIRVTDDGRGIAAEELPLAVASHATSKLQSADDLFRVHTLGFRGEALASIAAVSRLSIRSRHADAAAAAELRVEAGVVGEVRPAASPPGTTVEVRDLFLNTPVRRKFLRSVPTELGHAAEGFTRIALAYPDVHFTLQHNGRSVHELPPCGDVRERIAAFFGADLAQSLIAVASEEGDVRLAGFVANPMYSRTNNRLQFLFLNGRCIRDRSLQHALGEAYRGLLITGRYPICFLNLTLPPELVDVNVHPTKLEVRFQDAGRLYSQLLGMLRMKFLTVDLKARAHAGGGQEPLATVGPEQPAAPAQLVAWAKEQLREQQGRAEEVRGQGSEFSGQLSEVRGQASVVSGLWSEDRGRAPEEARLRLVPIVPARAESFARQESTVGWPEGPLRPTYAGHLAADLRTETIPTVSGERRVDGPHVTAAAAVESDRMELPRARALQVHNRYLIAETEEGLEVIDQHALHERILYEQLRERVLAGPLESQRLLVPEPIDLAAAEAAAVLEHRELLAALGVEVEPFGGGTVLVGSYPAMLANMRPAEVLRELIEHLLADGKPPERRDLLDRLLHSIACKAAVKYGDYLTPQEIDALLAQRHLARDHHHCPHGRPTALVFTRADLDRQFQRT
jgi:DNA mismatch repair protein MutL